MSRYRGTSPAMWGTTTTPPRAAPVGRACRARTWASSTIRVIGSTLASWGPRGRASDIAVQDGGLGEPRQAFLDGPGPGLAHALHVVEVLDRGPHDLLQVVEPG